VLRVKRKQMEEAGEPAFVDRTVAHFRTFHVGATQAMSDDELRFRIKHGLAKARGYGLTWESSLTVFVAHMVEICPAYDEHPAVQRVLRDARIPPDERTRALLSELTGEEWEEAARMCDADDYWAKVHAAEASDGDDGDDDGDDEDEP